MHKKHTDPACAAAERRSVRNSLAEWASYKGFEPAKHHLLIISEIEAFLASDDEVLLLFAPPGSAKSTYVSVLLPSWYLANHHFGSDTFRRVCRKVGTSCPKRYCK